MGLNETEKEAHRLSFNKNMAVSMRESRRRLTSSDFEALALIGKGAFGEVRLVRMKDRTSTSPIYAMKSMIKSAMINKNQVGHVRAERDILTESHAQWIVTLHYSFQDEQNLYMVMDYLPGGDLMGLLMKEDTFSETATKFYMAELSLAVACVHALGYIHRDLKPGKFFWNIFFLKYLNVFYYFNSKNILFISFYILLHVLSFHKFILKYSYYKLMMISDVMRAYANLIKYIYIIMLIV